MNETLETILWVVIVVGLFALVYWAQRDWPAPTSRRQPKELQAFCAYCRYCDGEDCINPKSPAYPGPIGEVCIGKWKCRAREERTWRPDTPSPQVSFRRRCTGTTGFVAAV